MALQIENPEKRKKAERIDRLLSLLFSPFLGSTRRRKGRCLDRVQFRRILLIRPHHLGDFIMFTPALAAMRRRFPESEIALLAGSWSEPLIRYNPHVDRVIYHDCLWWRKIRPGSKPSSLRYIREYLRLFHSLKQGRFDLAVDFLGDLRNILLFMQLPGARYKLGFERSGGVYFLTHSRPFELHTHEVKRCFDLLEPLGIREEPGNLEVFVSEKEESKAGEILKRHRLREKDFIVIHPGARLKIKRWPEERFFALAGKLRESGGHDVVLVGDRSDRERMERFDLEGSGIVDLCGKIDILVLKALLEKALCFIGNSSAGMHLAAAANCPTLGIIGPADPRRTAPHGVPYRLIQKPFDCSPCLEIACPLSDDGYGACLQAVRVEDAFRETVTFLSTL